MSSAIDKITSHFNKLVTNNLQEGYVEEWDLKFWFYPTYSIRDNAKASELMQQGKILEAVVENIITKAKKEDGSRMFRPADKSHFLNNADPKVVMKMAAIMNDADEALDAEEIEKN